MVNALGVIALGLTVVAAGALAKIMRLNNQVDPNLTSIEEKASKIYETLHKKNEGYASRKGQILGGKRNR